MFDKNYYLDNNPDVRNSNMDPLDHYLNYGYKELRKYSINNTNKFYLIKLLIL